MQHVLVEVDEFMQTSDAPDFQKGIKRFVGITNGKNGYSILKVWYGPEKACILIAWRNNHVGNSLRRDYVWIMCRRQSSLAPQTGSSSTASGDAGVFVEPGYQGEGSVAME